MGMFVPFFFRCLYLDSGLLFSATTVRISSTFGLDPFFFGDSCPNQLCIWTLSSFFSATTVRITTAFRLEPSFLTTTVRINSSFGLHLPFSSAPCPNHPPIRTSSSFFQRPLFKSPSPTKLTTPPT